MFKNKKFYGPRPIVMCCLWGGLSLAAQSLPSDGWYEPRPGSGAAEANSERVANTALNVPNTPPATATTYAVEDAFPGLTFSFPLSVVSPPNDTRRLFILEKGGTIRVIQDVTAVPASAALFFDLAGLVNGRVGESFTASGEQGLLGLAFHPDYANLGYFYVFYSVIINGQRHQRVSRFQVSSDPLLANPASEQVLIEQFDQASNHNGGDMHFGPDGYLYIAVGDEGGGNDNYSNSQRIDKDYFAGILRIDVDKLPGNLEPNPHPSVVTDGMGNAYYSVPVDNPWVGATTFNGRAVNPAEVITEFYAVGLRNPWRFSFDPVTGELWCADVGQNQWEEVNIIDHGGNYGWSFFEGNNTGPDTAPSDFVGIGPIYEYQHGSGEFEGRSITGGIVYRGNRYSDLQGVYVFGDYVSGNVWSLRQSGAGIEVARIAGSPNVVGFGRDPATGDVLLCQLVNGRIQRLVGDSMDSDFPKTLSATGIFADLTNLSPNPGVVPYTPILPFWSDHAIKQRWFTLPTTTEQIYFAEDTPWTFPAGMVWVKHFDLELERGNPATAKRLETRLLVKTEDGAFGVSYRWDDTGTEAHLAPDAGVEFDLDVIEEGVSRVQTWRIPSRAECLTCHLPQAGHALSFNTRQLNQTADIAGRSGNQIERLAEMGYFANPPEHGVGLPRHVAPGETQYSLESRVRSYLAVNCTYCHQSGPAAPASWDGTPALTLADTGLIHGKAVNDGGNSENKLVVPGDPLRSILLHRVAATNNFSRMPPLGTNELDAAAIAMLREWIQVDLLGYQTYDAWRMEHFGDTTSPEGERSANPDGDRNDNQFEFLARTDPLDSADYWSASLLHDAHTGLELHFKSIKNRGILIETSKDLHEWHLWQDRSNQGLPVADEALEVVPVTLEGKRDFFRLRIEEK